MLSYGFPVSGSQPQTIGFMTGPLIVGMPAKTSRAGMQQIAKWIVSMIHSSNRRCSVHAYVGSNPSMVHSQYQPLYAPPIWNPPLWSLCAKVIACDSGLKSFLCAEAVSCRQGQVFNPPFGTGRPNWAQSSAPSPREAFDSIWFNESKQVFRVRNASLSEMKLRDGCSVNNFSENVFSCWEYPCHLVWWCYCWSCSRLIILCYFPHRLTV